jgi:hypothetical protein
VTALSVRANRLPLEDSLQLLDASGPVFIMGCPRSGTTVLADLISLLPDVILKIGVIVPDRIMHLLGCGELSATEETHLLWAQRHIFWRAFLEMHAGWGWGLRDAYRSCHAGTLWRRRRPLSNFLFAYKEPFLLYACEKFAGHFAGAKFIHIIRDGRDCADSLARTYPHALTDQVLSSPLLWRLKGSEIGVARPWRKWFIPWWVQEGREEAFIGLAPFGRYVWMWQDMVRRGLSLAPQLGPGRLLELRYEEFCAHPLKVGKRLLEFIGTSPGGAYRKFLGSMSSASVGCHRKQPPDLIRQANWAGAPLLEELGYRN